MLFPLKLARTASIFLSACFFLFSSAAFAGETRLVLKAKMVSVEAFRTDEILHGLDSASATGMMPAATVVFKIESVVKGVLPPEKVPPSASLWNQAKESYKEKNFLQMITMDYDNPDIPREDQPRWFAVGVQSPLETFNVVSWSDLPQNLYRLSFLKDSETDGWILESASANS